ncbi:L,D-transpeptidase family protein [Carnobacterium sp.]|uniref:L,D-transpeptidase family protein n=1 Tax=Carnobacterium sp. TaxID=48221 RepID=UPI003C783E67
MNRRKMIFVGIAVFFVLTTGLYVKVSMQYTQQFLPKTTVDSLSISNMTIKEANQAIKKHYEGKEFKVVEGNKKLFSFKGTDIGVASDFAETLENEMKKQNSWTWPIKKISPNNTQLTMNSLGFNDDVVKIFLSDLPLNQGNRTKSEDAKIVKIDSNFSIQSEIKGNMFDEDKVKDLLKESVREGNTTIDLKQTYVKPSIVSTDKALKVNLDELKKLSSLSITHNIAGSKEIVPREILFDWLNINESGLITVDRNSVYTYMEELSTKYSTYEKTRDFKTSKRGIVKVLAGTYGWTLDATRETDSLVKDILLGENIERTPRYNGSGYTDDGNEFGENYIEIDLAAQHMWVYTNGQLFLETDIISGKPKTPTPKGVFYVWKKDRNATLTGEDYATPVDYWLPVDWDGVGIHDSPWQSNYGGSNHLTNGSHGCINTPPTIMSEIYNQIETGIPVVIY